MGWVLAETEETGANASERFDSRFVLIDDLEKNYPSFSSLGPGATKEAKEAAQPYNSWRSRTGKRPLLIWIDDPGAPNGPGPYHVFRTRNPYTQDYINTPFLQELHFKFEEGP